MTSFTFDQIQLGPVPPERSVRPLTSSLLDGCRAITVWSHGACPLARALSSLLPPSHALFPFAVSFSLSLCPGISLSEPPSLSPRHGASRSRDARLLVTCGCALSLVALFHRRFPPSHASPRPRSPPPCPARPAARPALRLVTRPRTARSITHVIIRPGPHRSAPRVWWSRGGHATTSQARLLLRLRSRDRGHVTDGAEPSLRARGRSSLSLALPPFRARF